MQEKYILLSSNTASAMPLFIFLGLSAKKEVEKQFRRVSLEQTGPLQGPAIEIERDFFATMKRIS
jgi:hypothetical protein